MVHRDRGATDILQVDLQLLPAEDLVEARGEEVQVVVMLELDPLHLQKLHAHVPLEEIISDVLLPSPLVASHLLPCRGTLGIDVQCLHQGHVLVH